jgi:hypothetical protein
MPSTGYAEKEGECAGKRGYGCWVVGIIRAVASFIMGQARHCARVWSAKSLATATHSLLRFLHVEGLISAPLVGAVPAMAGLEAVRPAAPRRRNHRITSRDYADHPYASTVADQQVHPPARHNPVLGITGLMPMSYLG